MHLAVRISIKESIKTLRMNNKFIALVIMIKIII